MAGYVKERSCTRCDTPGVHYTLLEFKMTEGARSLMQLEATCSSCTYNWVETYEAVPNSWFDEHE
jgi:hypothetical protein